MSLAPEQGRLVESYTRSLDCVHCGLCIESCPTYDVLGLETDNPRGRIYMMRALAEGRVEDPASVRPHLDRCLGCRACETVCPSGVRYGEILETVRGALEAEAPRRDFASRLRGILLRHVVGHQPRLRLAFRFARWSELLGLRRLAFALGLLPRTMDRLVPRVPPSPERRSLAGTWPAADGVEPRGRVHFFTGCVMEQIFGRINRATVELLVANGFEVVVPPTQGCCGALHLHDARTADAKALAARNLDAFADATTILHNSAGCGCALGEYGHLVGDDDPRAARFAERSRDVLSFLAEQGLTAEPAPARGLRVAHDAPCHLVHGQKVRGAVETLLERVPGVELVANPDSDTCCGSAGIYNLIHREIAADVGRKKARALADLGVDVVATGNPGCMMQIRMHLEDLGAGAVEVRHPVELLLPEKRASGAGPTPTRRA